MYDTVLTASTLAYSITCDALNIDCQLIDENISEFHTADDTIYMTNVSRYQVDVQLSSDNFKDNDAMLTGVMTFISAPVRRIKLETNASVTSINGWTAFNGGNTINVYVDDHSINYHTNRRYKTYFMTLVSESKYTIS